MNALRVIADDLTGACDVGAELLPWPAGVAVQTNGRGSAAFGIPADALCVRNTQSRTVAPAEAARRVAEALGDACDGWSGIVLKKIDTGLRGQLGAEIDAAMDLLGLDEAFVLPAIPEVGRTTEGGRQMIGGVPVHETAFARDPQNPISDSCVASVLEATSRRRAAVVGLEAIRAGELPAAVDAARAAGAAMLVCDAETDADLERAVRGLLLRTRPLLLVGSTGLARALRRVLGTEHGGRMRPAIPPAASGDGGVLVVVGSAHPTTRAQIERAVERRLITPVMVASRATAEAAGVEAGRLIQSGRPAALVPPADVSADGSEVVLAGLRAAALTALARVHPGGLALIGGETAYQVLEGLGHPPLWLEARLSPLVVRARLVAGAYGGLTLVTKGGSTGAPDLLGAIVRQLARGVH